MGGWLDPALLEVHGWRLWAGLQVTLQVVGISCAIGFVLSYPLAAMRISRWRLLRWPALGYITFFRGTPLLCQLYLVYYGAGEIRPALTAVGAWPFFRDAFFCCVFAFSLNTAAYQAEIVRGALLAVPAAQVEAARALGLSRYRVARHVVLPQAMLIALRPFGNELISIVKASALAAIVTLLDLMGQTRFIFARTFDFAIYLYAALIYLAITATIARAWSLIERRLSRHLNGRSEPAPLGPQPAQPVSGPALAPLQAR